MRMLAVGRLLVGATLIASPGRAGGRWLGPVTSDRAARAAVRGLAARDLAIGAGTLQALSAGTPVRGWAVAGGVGDLVDAAATLLAIRQVGLRRAVPMLVIASSAAAVTFASADHLD